MFIKFYFEIVDVFSVLVFYFFSKSNFLVKSNELVLIDDRLIEDRIGNDMFDIEFFIEFDVLGMNIYDFLFVINKFLENYRLCLLLKVVFE